MSSWYKSISYYYLPGFLVINLLTGIAAGILQLVIPLYALALKATTVQLGLVTGIGGIGRLFIVLPSGLMVDRYGPRVLFLISTGLCVALIFSLILVTTPFSLMLVMIFQGMAQSVTFMSLQASFLKHLPDLEVSQAGWQRGATSLGFFLLGPVIGGYLVMGNFQWVKLT
ncbi:MAG: MFS transporter [Clostridia bacterium]|nr:MFS transporter [Clostridia bacterium]